ncbi:MAG: cytochrome c family protein, partial [Planctomycetes bacterium]|nr:cytochrome c family protein [Planctomycetota bacterium]
MSTQRGSGGKAVGWSQGRLFAMAAVAFGTWTFSRLVDAAEPPSAPAAGRKPAVAAARSLKEAGSRLSPISREVIREAAEVIEYAVAQAHAACFVDDAFPSAKKCGVCHRKHYREWSVSPHAYAQLSPVFNAMSNTLIKVTNGTQGDFCIRCHTPIGMAREEPIAMSQMDRPPSSREGVTCVVCHRINQAWGKGAGRQALVPGDTTQVVYGPFGSQILEEVLADPDKYGVLTTVPAPGARAREVHAAAVPFWYLQAPAMCGACHDVFAPNGFRLEDAFSEYKTSPAALEQKLTCQDCHMGRVPGEPCGFDFEPIAVVGNASTPARRRTNHMFVGPDYSIIHPGLFPHHPYATHEEGEPESLDGLATMREWLWFDDAAGWGTEEFEENVPEGYEFPEPWKDPLRRIRARRILDDQHKLLAEATMARAHLLRVGYRMDRIEVVESGRRGLKFRVRVYNGTTGHGVPTGFDAERLVFLRVNVWDATGRKIYQSGDLDPNGDVRDSHSQYVHNGVLPLDRDLLSLQTKFIVRLQRGNEREQVLTFPFSLTPLPFIRPETRPFTVLGRPLAARKHKQNLEPGGERYGVYTIGPERLTGCGPYTAQVQLIAGMVPVNL